MNVEEAAEYLHISTRDLEGLVRAKEIPCDHRGPRAMFIRKELDAWASQRILGLSQPRLEKYHKTSTARAHDLSVHHAIIGELTRREAMEPALESRTKPAVIKDMVEIGRRTGLIYDPTALLNTLQERELLCSTGLPEGLALLHPRHHEPHMFADSFIALGRTVQKVPFGAPDGQSSDLFFLVCCQDDRCHLHVLARLCLMCLRKGLVSTLRTAPDANTMYSALLLAEQEVIRQV
jgi:mannitol/fructose-specific phosphotransferase system IIA component (Ntr-type)